MSRSPKLPPVFNDRSEPREARAKRVCHVPGSRLIKTPDRILRWPLCTARRVGETAKRRSLCLRALLIHINARNLIYINARN